MARFLKAKKEHIGLSPDSLYFRGEKKIDNTLLNLISYNKDQIEVYRPAEVSELITSINKNCINWINIYGLHDVDLLHDLTSQINISQHVLADVLNTHARPRIVEHEDCLYLSLKMLTYEEEKNAVQTENIAFIIKEGMLLSFQERVGDVFNPVRDRLQNPKRRVRNLGSDYLLFALVDIIIDNYSYIISKIGEKVEMMDELLINSTNRNLLHQLNTYKSELLYLRKAVHPCRELILSLVKLDTEFIDDDNLIFFNELQSNINQALDSVNSYKEMLSDQLNIYHTNVSSKLNDVMKVLTIFSVAFIPLTFIAGIYGTNFDYIPELKWRFGYFGMWGVMLVVTLAMMFYFKRKKWI